MRLIHAHHINPAADANTMRRECVAVYSWVLASQRGDMVDAGSGLKDMPRRFKDGDRDLPFVRDIIDFAFEKCKGDGDIIMLTNSDSVLAPDICAAIERVMASGVRGLYGARHDFQRIDAPMTQAQIAGGRAYCGNDIFVFRPEWWVDNREVFPDMVWATEAWDCVLHKMMDREGLPKIPNLVAHEMHQSRWCQSQNRITLPAQKHNLTLASQALGKLGVRWQPHVYGAIPQWATVEDKSQPIRTWCAWHIGDNLIHLNFLRKVALANPGRQFIHGAQPQLLGQLCDIVEDAKNIKLVPIANNVGVGVNAWKNAGGFFDSNPHKLDWANFHLHWFHALASQLGVHNPIVRVDDLLMDSPAIQKPTPLSQPFDVLVLNLRPGSGQFNPWSPTYFDPIIATLKGAGRSVICAAPTAVAGVPCTLDAKLTCAGIGNLSLHCKVVIGVPGGPFWPTANVWNRDSVKLRVICLEREHLTGFMNNAVQVANCEQALEALRRAKVV